MSVYNPPIENVPIFDSALFRDTNTESSLTVAQADKRYLRFPLAQGDEALLNTTVSGTLGVSGVTTLNEEAIIQTSHGVTNLQSLRIRDTVSSQSMVFNPNAVNNTYNGIVEASDAVITTSNNNNALVLTNTNSTTTNGIRISRTKTVIGNGGAGTDIPSNNITFDNSALNSITINSTGTVLMNNNLTLPTAGAILTVGSAGSGSLQMDFTTVGAGRFITTTVGGSTTIPILPNSGTGSSVRTHNSSDPLNSAYNEFGTNATETYIRSQISGTGTLLPYGIYMGTTKVMNMDTAGALTLLTASTSNANISFANAGAKLKYSAGTAGQVPISDATGLLTLGTVPALSLSYINATMPATGTALALGGGGGTFLTYASISLTAGTWNVRGYAGIGILTGTPTLTTVIVGIGTTTNATPNIYSVSQYLNLLFATGRILPLSPIETIITVASTTTYYLIVNVSYTGGASTFEVPVGGGQQLFAVRIAP